MNKRIFALLMLVACLPLFCGCQLAKPEAGETQPDRLVGVYITINQDLSPLDYDPFDQFMKSDMEKIIDNVGKVVDGVIPDLASREEERIYGVPMKETVTNEVGEEYTERWFEFPDIDGIELAEYVFKEGYDSYGEPIEYWSYNYESEISDRNTVVGSDGPIEITGTIYINSNVKEILVYLNPVYQTESGEVYILPGGGHNLTENSQGTTLSIWETYTDENDEERKTTVSVTFNRAEPCETVNFIQMDNENNVLRMDTFDSTETPDEFNPQEDTAYIIVEEHSKNGIERSMYDEDDYLIKVPCFGVRGFLPTKDTAIMWPSVEE